MYEDTSDPNTIACRNPVNNPNIVKNSEKGANKSKITPISTSPAKMLPNNLSDNEITFANSEIISSGTSKR